MELTPVLIHLIKAGWLVSKRCHKPLGIEVYGNVAADGGRLGE